MIPFDLQKTIEFFTDWGNLICAGFTAFLGYKFNEMHRKKNKVDKLIEKVIAHQSNLNKEEILKHIIKVIQNNFDWKCIDLQTENTYRLFFSTLYHTLEFIEKQFSCYHKKKYFNQLIAELHNETLWISSIFILQENNSFTNFKNIWIKANALEKITFLVEYYEKASFSIPEERLNSPTYEYIYTNKAIFSQLICRFAENFNENCFNNADILDKARECYGIALYEQQKYQEALNHFQKVKTERNFTLYYLGLIYHYHIPEEKQSIQYFKKSADLGNRDAEYELGRSYLSTENTKKDIQQAIFWLEKSAKHGNYHASYQLALIYLSCQEIPQDLDKAYYWAEQANNTMPILPKQLNPKLRPYALMRRIRQLQPK